MRLDLSSESLLVEVITLVFLELFRYDSVAYSKNFDDGKSRMQD